jgi:hypothetical protein
MYLPPILHAWLRVTEYLEVGGGVIFPFFKKKYHDNKLVASTLIILFSLFFFPKNGILQWKILDLQEYSISQN